MRLRRLMGVSDQIVASCFSSIDLSNKAMRTNKLCYFLAEKLFSSFIFHFILFECSSSSTEKICQLFLLFIVLITTILFPPQ